MVCPHQMRVRVPLGPRAAIEQEKLRACASGALTDRRFSPPQSRDRVRPSIFRPVDDCEHVRNGLVAAATTALLDSAAQPGQPRVSREG